MFSRFDLDKLPEQFREVTLDEFIEGDSHSVYAVHDWCSWRIDVSLPSEGCLPYIRIQALDCGGNIHSVAWVMDNMYLIPTFGEDMIIYNQIRRMTKAIEKAIQEKTTERSSAAIRSSIINRLKETGDA